METSLSKGSSLRQHTPLADRSALALLSTSLNELRSEQRGETTLHSEKLTLAASGKPASKKFQILSAAHLTPEFSCGRIQ